VGKRDLPTAARVLNGSAQTLLVRERGVDALLAALMAADVQHCLVEGGPTLAASLLDADLIDEVVWFVAPVLFGAGPIALPALAHHRRVTVRRVEMMGDDVLLEGDLSHVHRDH
jgi:diaminohydroxyphosphoribosylaminopyrimidine deaminase/5-amino-6-(5-phosphoribosylamino)uracil reductase